MRLRGIVSAVATVAALTGACTSAASSSDGLAEIDEQHTGAASDLADPEDEASAPEAEAAPDSESPDPVEAASAEAPPETDTVPEPDVDITTVPEEITVEYVQAVLDELERIYAEAVVLMMEEGELTLEISDRIGEIFAQRQVDLRRSEFVDTAEAGFPAMRPPEDITTRRRIVEDILDQGEGCIYVETLTNDHAFFADPVEAIEVFVLLEYPTVERPVELNPTPWVYGALGVGERAEMEAVTPCAH